MNISIESRKIYEQTDLSKVVSFSSLDLPREVMSLLRGQTATLLASTTLQLVFPHLLSLYHSSRIFDFGISQPALIVGCPFFKTNVLNATVVDLSPLE